MFILFMTIFFVQCPLDIPTLDKAAALPIAAATRVTDLRQYINSNLAYRGLNFFVLFTNKWLISITMNYQPLHSTSTLISSLWSFYFEGERTAFSTCQSIKYLYFALFFHNFCTKTLRIPEYLTTHKHVNTCLGSPKHVLKQTYRSKLIIP